MLGENAQQTTPSEQGESYADLSESVIAEIEAKPSQVEKKTTQKASAEDILRSLDGAQAKAESDEQVIEEEVEQVETSEVDETQESEEELIDIIYKGQVEPMPKAEVIKLAQMGKDYTQKTQALALERQKFQTESAQQAQKLESMRAEIENNKATFSQERESFDKLKFAFDVMSKQNPDLYQEVDNAINSVLNQYDNPMIRQRIDMYDQKSKMLEDQLNKLMDAGVRSEYQQQESQVKATYDDKLKSMGVIVDWQKVKEAFANEGYGDVKKAMLSIYGEEIVAAKESKAKLDAVRKQAARVPGKPSIATGSKGSKQPTDYSKMGYGDITQSIMKEYGL
jgi:hypothetical protein